MAVPVCESKPGRPRSRYACCAFKAALVLALVTPACGGFDADGHDLVILEGRVVDPETGLDAIRNVGIREGRIVSVTEEAVEGSDTLRAAGLVVAPGFIDVHAHGQDPENYRVRVRDGVTTALELELGSGDVDRFYAEREGRALIHHGVSSGHVPVRISVMDDAGTRLPVGPAANREGSPDEVEAIVAGVRRGLEEGAVAVGFSLQNTPAASRDEVLRIFRVAAEFGVAVHVHIRHMGPYGESTSMDALEEVLEASRQSGAPLHVAHVHSVGLEQTGDLLERIAEEREEGLDVTAEVYPYAAGQTSIEGSFFAGDWRERLGIGYADLEWPPTGERLTAESYARYRAQGGIVIIHMIPEEAVRRAVADPNTMIASDGLIQNGRGHPRAAGSYSRVLGRFVREDDVIDFPEAIGKMTLLPARRLEGALPQMRQKGRVQVGADADLVLLDTEAVRDEATYEDPILPPTGIPYVIVAGVVVVRDGVVDESRTPGLGIRRIH